MVAQLMSSLLWTLGTPTLLKCLLVIEAGGTVRQQQSLHRNQHKPPLAQAGLEFEIYRMAAKLTKAQTFQDEMQRLRGIDFAFIGMQIEMDGDIGTIVGMNVRANLDVTFANQAKYGKHKHNVHPTWRMKYFDATGALIAHFGDEGCILRPSASVA